MNVVKIYGGLGNQFFQYAFGETMIEQQGCTVGYEMGFFSRPQEPPRPYCLDKFKIRNIAQSFFLPNNEMVHEKAEKYYVFDPSVLNKDNCNYYGYWQNVEYFKSILPRLQQEFKLKADYYTPELIVLKEEAILNESISLHIRRGDYISIKGHYNLQDDYYNQAIKILRDKGIQGKVFIFSDDIPWCKTQYIGSNYIFVDLNEWSSFELMRVCKHNIIANSTFSWWAAFLNPNPGKIVISPRIWRKNVEEQANVDRGELNVSNWIRI
jgi:hypothetical protein